MTRKFSYRHLLVGFLKLKNLLIHKMTLLVYDHIGIQGTPLPWILTWLRFATTRPR
jgi:hypothetical protein